MVLWNGQRAREKGRPVRVVWWQVIDIQIGAMDGRRSDKSRKGHRGQRMDVPGANHRFALPNPPVIGRR